MSPTVGGAGSGRQRTLLFPGGAGWNGAVDDTTTAHRGRAGPGRAAAEAVAFAARSDLDRYVGGERHLEKRSFAPGDRPAPREPGASLPLAQGCWVLLDDLVGALEVGDPRIRLKARRVNGRTVPPLTRSREGCRHGRSSSRPRTANLLPSRTKGTSGGSSFPAGCVLSSATDLALGLGEAAEFDTHVSRWFGSTGDQPAEILGMFGPRAERAHARARSVSKKASAE